MAVKKTDNILYYNSLTIRKESTVCPSLYLMDVPTLIRETFPICLPFSKASRRSSLSDFSFPIMISFSCSRLNVISSGSQIRYGDSALVYFRYSIRASAS